MPRQVQTVQPTANKTKSVIIGIAVTVAIVVVVAAVTLAILLTRKDSDESAVTDAVTPDPSQTETTALIPRSRSTQDTTQPAGNTTESVTPTPQSNLGTGNYTLESCMRATDCWVRYDFLHDDMYYPCSGNRYVRYLEEYNKYVGLIICEKKRYHIFLSSEVTSIFENVGDSAGKGEDHCEFVGGTVDGNVSPDEKLSNFVDMPGVYRRTWNDTYIRSGTLGRYRNAAFVPWIECPGTNIPADSYVVQADDINYPPATRACYFSSISMNETISWRHTTTPPRALTGESPSVHTYSCTTSLATDHEVHVLSIYESSDTISPNLLNTPFSVKIEADYSRVQHPIVLILASYRSIDWKVSISGVQFNKVVVICPVFNILYTNVTITDNQAVVSVPVERIDHFLGIGNRKPRQLKEYLEDKFGFITSFIGRYRPTGYTLRTGTNELLPGDRPTTNEPVPTTPTTLPSTTPKPSTQPTVFMPTTTAPAPDNNIGTGTYTVESCMHATDCWVRYDFLHDDMYYPCPDNRYVRYLEEYNRYVGIRVCQQNRYHIFLSSEVTSIFENVGDSAGKGEDHCEFVGGTADGNVSPDERINNFVDMTGMYRRTWDDIYIRSGSLGRYKNAMFVPWIECPGTNIPADSYVVQADDVNYPPATRACFFSAIPMNETLSWRHTTTTVKNPSDYTYSCTTDLATDHEVHVLSIYSSSDTISPNLLNTPFSVRVEADSSRVQHPIVLVLASFKAVDWKVSISGVQLNKVVLICVAQNIRYTNVTVTENQVILSVPEERIEDYLGYGARTPRQLKEYLEDKFGFITSFLGSSGPTGYTLKTGT